MSEYNGWTNRETWCVALWMDNTYGIQQYWEALAAEYLEIAENDFVEAKYNLAKTMENEIKERTDTLIEKCHEFDGLYEDMLEYAFCRVNWEEIAEAFLNR